LLRSPSKENDGYERARMIVRNAKNNRGMPNKSKKTTTNNGSQNKKTAVVDKQTSENDVANSKQNDDQSPLEYHDDDEELLIDTTTIISKTIKKIEDTYDGDKIITSNSGEATSSAAVPKSPLEIPSLEQTMHELSNALKTNRIVQVRYLINCLFVSKKKNKMMTRRNEEL